VVAIKYSRWIKFRDIFIASIMARTIRLPVQRKRRTNAKAPRVVVVKSAAPRRAQASGSAPRSGGNAAAITRINTAPVAIGNSMKGARANVIHQSDGSVRLVGRDYALTCYSSGTVNGWLLVGAFPLTPACFSSSVIRAYVQIYNKFKFNEICCHYITSSPTSSNGDVLLYWSKNRTDPIVNWTSSTFLPFAMSDPNAVLGPQWTNHSMCIKPSGPTRTLDPGMNIDIDYQAQGEFLIFSKTSSTESAGYVLFDYDITLSELSVNPRAGLLPNPNLIYQAAQLIWPTTALTAGTTINNLSTGTFGSGGTTLSTLDSTASLSAGDVMKVVVDLTNTNAGAWTVSAGATPTASTLFNYIVNAATEGMTLTDGMTLYMTHGGTTSYRLYPTLVDALASNNPLVAGFSGTPSAYGTSAGVPNAGIWLQVFVSYCCTSNVPALQQR
jgi:hypothetical protein